MYSDESGFYYRKQLMISEMMLHFGVIKNREEFYTKYADRFRTVYEKKAGNVCVDDLLH